MSEPQVIACFVIHREGEIVYQGSFQVGKEEGIYSFPSTDGGHFDFSHSFEGARCFIGVSYSMEASLVAREELVVPINRTKVKWKKSPLGESHVIFYRCAFEDCFGPKAPKEFRKLRRKAAVARVSSRSQGANVNLYYSGEPKGEEDA